MPRKRRTAKERATKVPPEAVAAFQRGDKDALDLAIGLRPWECSPFDVDGDEPPEWMRDQFQKERWRNAREIRLELEAALRADQSQKK